MAQTSNNKNLNQNQSQSQNIFSSTQTTDQENQNQKKLYLEFCSPDYDPEVDEYECAQYFDDSDYVDTPELGYDPEEEEEEEE